MRYADLPRLYAGVSVTSPPLQRRAAPPAAPQDIAPGARWGRPSRFSWSTAAALFRTRGQSITIEYPQPKPRHFMRVITAELKVMSERVRVEAPEDPSLWVEVDRMTRMAFHFTEFPPKRTPTSLQPARTTVYDLAFDLHPPADTEYVPEE